MKSFVVANWKMNPQTFAEAKFLFNLIKKKVKKVKKIEVVICPPFLYSSLLTAKKIYNLKIKLGAQNCFWEEKGAYTGEISPSMLKGFGIEYVIIGHSERRRILGETDEMINKKIKKIISLKLKPIFCIGETKKEKREKEKVLKNQIRKGLKGILRKDIKNIIIAYEPVWAIGTGVNCSVEETMSTVILIRKIISRLYRITPIQSFPILYGGSVNSKNANCYLKESGVNGLLVGGASLNPKEFIKIINSLG